MYFHTCQVCVSCPAPSSASSFSFPSARPQLQTLDCSVPRRTRTANSGSEWSLPDFNCKRHDHSVPRRTRTASTGSECSPPDGNCKRKIAVVLAGPVQQTQDQSVPGRTPTASARLQCSPPDPNSNDRIKVFPAAPQLQALYSSQCSSLGPYSKRRIKVFPAGPQLQALDRSGPCRTRTANAGSECSRPDTNCKR